MPGEEVTTKPGVVRNGTGATSAGRPPPDDHRGRDCASDAAAGVAAVAGRLRATCVTPPCRGCCSVPRSVSSNSAVAAWSTSMEAARTWLMRRDCCASDDGVVVTSVATSASIAIRRDVPALVAPPSPPPSTLLPRGGRTGLGNALPGRHGGWTTPDAVPGRAEGLPGAGGDRGLCLSLSPPSPSAGDAATAGLRSCMAASRMRSP